MLKLGREQEENFKYNQSQEDTTKNLKQIKNLNNFIDKYNL